MARRLWMIGVAGVGVVALAFAPEAARNDSATAVSAPASTVDAVSTTTPATSSTSPPPTSSTSSTTTSTSTTTTSTTTTTTSTTTTPTLPPAPPAFDGAAFDIVISAGTVGLGDVSAGVAVMRDGHVLHAAAFGMENPAAAKPATTGTRFRLASISKMLTAAAIMQLAGEGKVDLDGPFASQLGAQGPFLDPRVGTVTVRQLLSHMSGFPVSRSIFFGRGVEDWRQAADAALGQVLQTDPGTAFRYSNTNYCLLGLLLEHVTGQRFEQAIDERVLEPLHIHAHLAPTFDTQLGDAVHASGAGRNYMEVLGPAGGWVATPIDIAKLAASFRPDWPGPRLLDREAVATMRVSVPVPVEVPPPATWWSYGMGLMLFADGSWGHTGTIESTHAVVVNRPDGLTVALLVSGKYPANSDDLLPLIESAVVAATM